MGYIWLDDFIRVKFDLLRELGRFTWCIGNDAEESRYHHIAWVEDCDLFRVFAYTNCEGLTRKDKIATWNCVFRLRKIVVRRSLVSPVLTMSTY